MFILLVFLSFFSFFVKGIYVPGLILNEFKKGDEISVMAVKLSSSITQLPFKYYTLPFCQPEEIIKYSSNNIGEIIRGDRVVNTPYNVLMAINRPCVTVCKPVKLNARDILRLKLFIEQDYYVHLVIDDLPCGTRLTDSDIFQHYKHGYKLGFILNDQSYLNNHLIFKLQYHLDSGISSKSLDIVGESCKSLSTLHRSDWMPINENTSELQFTYEVVWEKSDIKWASRWDVFIKSRSGDIHWFSILNSTIIAFFLTSVISLILIRSLRKDIAKYNRDDDVEEILEESGWKLVHGDVFRSPRHTRLLTALFGSGLQLFFMTFIVICTLSPASRGAFMSAAIFTYVFMGVFAGYFAGRFYKTLRGHLWRSTALLTGLLFPSVILIIGSILNSFIWYKGSSAALPFTTTISLLALWLCVSLPLIVIGFFFGFRKRGYEHPIRINQIPRAVPEHRIHSSLFATTMFTGILSFGAVFVELFFIYNAIWEGEFYYLFGFLFIVFIFLILCCSQLAIIVTYLQLCNENYHWWWRTFISSGGSAIYLFGYSIFYYITRLNITEFVPTVIYFGYSLLISITFWNLTGAIGFTSTYIFLRYIYSAIKID